MGGLGGRGRWRGERSAAAGWHWAGWPSRRPARATALGGLALGGLGTEAASAATALGGLAASGGVATETGPGGSQEYTTPGTYTFTAPTTATYRVAPLRAVGMAAAAWALTGGGGGGEWATSSLSLTGGHNYTVIVGTGGASMDRPAQIPCSTYTCTVASSRRPRQRWHWRDGRQHQQRREWR